MIYIRILLSKIRTISAKLNEKQKIALIILECLLLVFGVVIDIFLPFNYFLNTLRAFIAVCSGVLLFSFAYLFANYRFEKKIQNGEDPIYFRDKFSKKERINISVILWGILFIITLFGANPNPFFTFLSSLEILSALSILTFVRSSREEDAQKKLGFEDYRDATLLERKMERKKEKEKLKQLKKENKKKKKKG